MQIEKQANSNPDNIEEGGRYVKISELDKEIAALEDPDKLGEEFEERDPLEENVRRDIAKGGAGEEGAIVLKTASPGTGESSQAASAEEIAAVSREIAELEEALDEMVKPLDKER